MKARYELDEAVKLIEHKYAQEVKAIERITDTTFHYRFFSGIVNNKFFDCSKVERESILNQYSHQPMY